MEPNPKIPKLMEFLYGEAAEAVQQVANERLERWSRAFDDWLEERRQKFKPAASKNALQAWQQLLRELRKVPYEMAKADIEAFVAWLWAQDYSPNTIYDRLKYISMFYRWCGERGVDPQCESGYNPAAGVTVTRPRPYSGAGPKPVQLLSREEAQALLETARRDNTPLGKRDYAFLLLRLRTGPANKTLQQLKWGLISLVVTQSSSGVVGELGSRVVTQSGSPVVEDSRVDGEAWVRWRAEGEPWLLPAEVWGAIVDYLEASGRLGGMQADDYIFAPLTLIGRVRGSDRAEVWEAQRCVRCKQLLDALKVYGRAAGIPEEKLTIQNLRLTAIRMRLDEGGSEALQGMKDFLDSSMEKGDVKYWMRKVPEFPQAEGQNAPPGGDPPNRSLHVFETGEGLKHGWYAQSLPADEVQAVMQEDIQGIDEEIAGLRSLERGLFELQQRAFSQAQGAPGKAVDESSARLFGRQAARLTDAYTQAAARLATMIKAEEQMEKRKGGEERQWVEEVLAMFDEVMRLQGLPPYSATVWDRMRASNPEQQVNERRLKEEIASTRYLLRNTLTLAGRALQKEDIDESIRLVDLYGSACSRLVRLRQSVGDEYGQLFTFLRQEMDGIIDQAVEEFGLAEKYPGLGTSDQGPGISEKEEDDEDKKDTGYTWKPW